MEVLGVVCLNLATVALRILSVFCIARLWALNSSLSGNLVALLRFHIFIFHVLEHTALRFTNPNPFLEDDLQNCFVLTSSSSVFLLTLVSRNYEKCEMCLLTKITGPRWPSVTFQRCFLDENFSPQEVDGFSQTNMRYQNQKRSETK